MLTLNPNSECRDADPPPEAEARIRSFECAFCLACADESCPGVAI